MELSKIENNEGFSIFNSFYVYFKVLVTNEFLETLDAVDALCTFLPYLIDWEGKYSLLIIKVDYRIPTPLTEIVSVAFRSTGMQIVTTNYLASM